MIFLSFKHTEWIGIEYDSLKRMKGVHLQLEEHVPDGTHWFLSAVLAFLVLRQGICW